MSANQKSFIVYNELGVILRVGSAPASMIDIQANEGQGEAVIEGVADINLQYIAANLVVNKYAVDAAISGPVLSGLPMPCTLRIDEQVYDVTDGIAELSFNLPGTYTVRVEALHYIPREYQVTV